MALKENNKEEILISCVMIFLDGEKYLEESIRSVIDQSFSGWELILVDDGSVSYTHLTLPTKA